MTNGVYVIVDGGYHKWKATMSASRHGSGESFTQWREQLESVRKDIECREYSCRSNAATHCCTADANFPRVLPCVSPVQFSVS